MQKQHLIGEHLIGCGSSFTIAEAGINHNGDLDLAFEMVEIAKNAGADAIKFQTFKATEFIFDSKLEFTYKSRGKTVTEPMLDMFARHEFSPDQWKKLKKRCDEKGIIFLSTPQNFSDLRLLLEIGIQAIKVGSDDFTNIPLITKYAQHSLPMILSIGMADLGEIFATLQQVTRLSKAPIILMLCTSQYPTPPEDVNLNKLQTLKAVFPFVHLGFSDHTEGHLAASLASAFGCRYFEKHFTTSHDLEGPDHWFSADPNELAEWVNSIKTAEKMFGKPDLVPTQKEQEMRILARRSVVAMTDIKANESLSEDKIGLRRPGDGLPPALMMQMINKTATRDIKRGEQLRYGDFRS